MVLENALAKIRGKRCELKITQDEMAKRLGITRKTYNHKENGSSEFTFKEVLAICSIFKCSFSDIFLSNEVSK